jgi:hypothetical protein
MTNFDIIFNEAVASGIYTEAEAIAIIEARGALPLHTFSEWKKHGMSVKKGEHAKLTCYIWKHENKKAVVPMTEGEDQEIDEERYYKVKAFFFTAEQVERITA